MTTEIKYMSGVAVAAILSWWVSLHFAVQSLILFQFLDMVTGAAASVVLKKTSSQFAWKSITVKKFMAWVVVAVMHRLQDMIGPAANVTVGDMALSLGAGAALTYCWVEVLSILENAGKVEVLPPAINQVIRQFMPGARPTEPVSNENPAADGSILEGKQ